MMAGSVQADKVPAEVQNNLCYRTKNNDYAGVLKVTTVTNVILKRDFNNISCGQMESFEGGTLFQTAVHYKRFGMMDSFLDEHGLDINLIDVDGNTILDWVDEKIADFDQAGVPRQVKRFKKLRKILVEDYEAKSAKDL